jgi:integrase
MQAHPPFPPEFAYRQFQRLIKESEVSRNRLHDLRHTHATWLLEAAEPLHVVAERLGHANSSTTANIYAHVTERQRRQGAETYRRIMDGR